MKMSTRGRYGLKVMHYLAKENVDQPIPLSVIAADLELPENYLEQLMRKLKKSNLVTSVRGSCGGYKLSKPAKEMYVGEILRSLENSMLISDCSRDNFECSNECACSLVWKRIQKSIDNAIDSYTLEDMLAEEKSKF